MIDFSAECDRLARELAAVTAERDAARDDAASLRSTLAVANAVIGSLRGKLEIAPASTLNERGEA